jgi:hypothetical protein
MSKLNPVDTAFTHSEVSASITLQYLYSKQLLIKNDLWIQRECY